MTAEVEPEPRCSRCGKTAAELGDPFLLTTRCWTCEVAHLDEQAKKGPIDAAQDDRHSRR